MSVVTLPRRIDPAPARPRAAGSHRITPRRTGIISRWRSSSTTIKVSVVMITASLLVLMGNAYATQRQIEIHQMQTELLSAQARYAAQVAALTNSTAPAAIASKAVGLHLVLPTSVTQIQSVPLNIVLAPPVLNGRYHLLSRIYR